MFYAWPAGEVFLLFPTLRGGPAGERTREGAAGAGARQLLNEGSQRRTGPVGCSIRGER